MLNPPNQQQGTFAEKDEQLRQILSKLDTIENDEAVSTLTHEDIVSLRRQLADAQVLIRETVDRLRQSQEENEMHVRRRDELESRITALETEYEELLGASRFLPFAGREYSGLGEQRKQFTMKTLATWTSPSRWPSSR